MKILRTIFLPLILCGAILAVGFCTPMLFNVLVPDQKETVEIVSIAGKESPLYLETDTDVALPPWDEISEADSRTLEDYLSRFADAESEAGSTDLINDFTHMLVSQFVPELPESLDFAADMRVSNDRLAFLHDYAFADIWGTRYTLDLVIDLYFGHPLCVHVRPRAEATRPAADADTVLAQVEDALILWQNSAETWMMNGAADADQMLAIMEEQAATGAIWSTDSSFSLSMLRSFCDFLRGYEAFFENYDEAQQTITAIVTESFFLQVSYAIPYEDEIVIVLTDAQNNPYILYLDGVQNTVTGFGLDHP